MKKIILPILVVLSLAVSCDKGGSTVTPTPPPDNSLKLNYTIGSTNYNLTYLGAVKDTISTPNRLLFSGTQSNVAFYPSLVFTFTKPVNGWNTTLKNIDTENQENNVELKLGPTIIYSTKYVIPSDTSGMNVSFSKLTYVYGSLIEGTFEGSVAAKENPSQLVYIKNGSFRLKLN